MQAAGEEANESSDSTEQTVTEQSWSSDKLLEFIKTNEGIQLWRGNVTSLHLNLIGSSQHQS